MDPCFLDLGANWRSAFTPRETAPVTHWMGGWVDPTTGQDYAKKKKTHDPTGTRT
jgi:hypothetical protein